MVVSKTENISRKDIVADIGKSMSVEAGAGAGKTSLIVKRNIEQLKSGALRASQLVDITFTNAAAEELRGRLIDELRKEAANPANTPAEKENLERAVKEECFIQISTIHSFCNRLLSEQTFAARIPMDAKLLDNAEATAFKAKFFSEWYKNQNAAELKVLNDNFISGSAGDYVYNTFLSICELPDDMVIRYEDGLLSAGSRTLKDYIAAMRLQMNALLAEALNVANGYSPTPYADVASLMAAKNAKGTRYLVSKALRDAFDGKGAGPRKLAAVYGSLWEYVDKKNHGLGMKLVKAFNGQGVTDLGINRATAGQMNDDFAANIGAIDNLAIALDTYQNALIVDWAVKARTEYRKYCQQAANRGFITNDALLQEALRLISSNPDAKAYFQSKFSCIYVDEFQDTDLVQEELVEQLCDDPANPGHIKPGSLFFVGDPKQSIYAFRGADLDVYQDVRAKYASPALPEVEEYTLSDNYRTESSIIEWVNGEFSKKFTGYVPMNAPNNNAPASDVLCGPYRLNYPIWDKNGDTFNYVSPDIYPGGVNAAKEKDADVLLAIIKDLTDGSIGIWDRDKEGRWFTRPIRFNDFLVLCPKKKDLNRYAAKMKRAGIPINLYGALDVEEEDVIIRFRSLYHFLAYPFDRKACYGAMEVLAGSHLTEGNRTEAKARANLLFETTRDYSPLQLLQYLAHHIELVFGEDQPGVEITRAQSRLQQLLEAVSANALGDRKDVDKQIEAYMVSDTDRELSLEPDADAVRFMNLHKAKGLEGKIVIVASRAGRKLDASSYRHLKECFPAAIGGGAFGNDSIPGYMLQPGMVAKAEDRIRAEFDRLDYVEATRAMEALIFMDALCTDCVFNDYDLMPLRNLCIEFPGVGADIQNALGGTYAPVATAAATQSYDVDCWKAAIDPSQNQYQYRGIIPSGMETYDAWEPGADPVPRPEGNVFGVVMHRVFELAVEKIRGGESVEAEKIVARAMIESYDDIVGFLTNQSDIDAEIEFYRSYLVSRLEAFLADAALMAAVKSAKAVYTELEFSQYADPDELAAMSEGLKDKLDKSFAIDPGHLYWVNGQADLVIVGQDGKVSIVDYKSDHKGTKTLEELDEHLHKSYDNQQELYRYVVSKALGVPVSDISYTYYHMYG